MMALQIVIGVVCGVGCLALMRWLCLKANEEEQAHEAEERRVLDRVMAANRPPSAPGHPHRKVSG